MSITFRAPNVPGYARTTLGVLAILVVPLGLLLATMISASLRSVELASTAADAENELARLDRLTTLEVSLAVERLANELEQTHDESEIRSADLRLLRRKTLRSLGDVASATDEALGLLPLLDRQLAPDLVTARSSTLDGSDARTVSARFDSLMGDVHAEVLAQETAATRAVVALRDDETAIALQRSVASRNAVLAHLDLIDRLIDTWAVERLGLELARTELTEVRARWLAAEEQLSGVQERMPADGGRFDRIVDLTLLLETPVLGTGSVAVAELIRATSDGFDRQEALTEGWSDAATAVRGAAETRRSGEESDARWGALLATVAVLASFTAAGIYVATNVRNNRENHRLTRALEIQAHRDHLTGEANRAAAVRVLQDHLDGLRRPLAVAFFDLDRFKSVNDTYGHTAGDELLRAAARRTRRTVGSTATVARFGGDEFVVIVPDLTTDEDPAEVIRLLHAALQEPYEVEGTKIHTTASLGLVIVRPGDGTERADDALRRAALAVDAAKEVRGTMIVFTPEFGAEIEDESRLQRELMDALGVADQLRLAFQPIVDIDTGRVREVEALVRWEHPTRADVGPVDFIPSAERSGAISALDLWVMRRALTELETLRRTTGRHDLAVAVNVSGTTLLDKKLHERVLGIVADVGVDPRDLVVEVTETAFISDIGAASDNLDALRRAGVRIAIDDFGTGYTSISQIRSLPADILKLDRSLLDPGSAERSDLVRVVADLARAFRLETIVEGIEDDETLDLVRSLGCDRVQGIGLCPPLPATEVAAAIRALDDGTALSARGVGVGAS